MDDFKKEADEYIEQEKNNAMSLKKAKTVLEYWSLYQYDLKRELENIAKKHFEINDINAGIHENYIKTKMNDFYIFAINWN